MATKVQNGLDLQSQKISNLASPSISTDAANKIYVDNVANGITWKTAVRLASTANITVSSPGATIDGVTASVNDRILLKNQTAAAENGLWTFNGAAVALTRTNDGVTGELLAGSAVFVTEGTVNADKAYVLTTTGTITVGTTSQAWTQFGGGTTYVAGNGLNLVGSTFNVVAGTGIIADGTSTRVDFSAVPKKFATNVGDGSSTAITVTHNLNTRDVIVQLFESATPWDMQIVDVTLPSVNTATLTFATAPASNAYRVVIIG